MRPSSAHEKPVNFAMFTLQLYPALICRLSRLDFSSRFSLTSSHFTLLYFTLAYCFNFSLLVLWPLHCCCWVGVPPIRPHIIHSPSPRLGCSFAVCLSLTPSGASNALTETGRHALKDTLRHVY